MYTLVDYEKSLFCWKSRKVERKIKLNSEHNCWSGELRASLERLRHKFASSNARTTRDMGICCSALEYRIYSHNHVPFPILEKRERLSETWYNSSFYKNRSSLRRWQFFFFYTAGGSRIWPVDSSKDCEEFNGIYWP